MFQAITEWTGMAVGAIVATVLGWIGVDTVRSVRRHEREKADRAELARMMDLMEKREDDARKGRSKLHDEVKEVVDKLGETNVQLARLAGRIGEEK